MVQLPGLSSPWDDKTDHEDQPPGSTGEQGLIEPSPPDCNPAQVTPKINALPSSSTSEAVPGLRPGPNKYEIQDPVRRRVHTAITGHGRTKRHRTIISDEWRGRLFACPYFKHDPMRYGTKEWRSCVGPGWEIPRLKEHLRRRHYQRGHKCNCCIQWFSSLKELSEHQISDVRCEPMDDVHDDSIDDTQWGKIQERNRGMEGEAKWSEIYKIIFPLDVVPSPYIEENGDPKAPDLQAPEFFFGDFGTTHAATAPAMSTLFPLDDESLSYWVWDNNDPRADSWTYDQEAALIDVELSHIDEPVPSSEMSLRNTQAIISGTTAWTDSGYGSNSKLEPGFQLDGLNKMNAAEMHDLTDSATCFSETPSLLDPRLQEYTTAFAGDLADLVPRDVDTGAVEKLLESLPDLLKEFATNITFDGDTSHHENLMYFVYKHNSSIVQHVRERFAKSVNQDSENEMPREQSDNPPWKERITMLLGREHPESTPHDVIPTENEYYDEDANEDPESLQIAVHRDVLARSSAYECLVARIRGELLLEVPGTTAARNEVRDYISKAIGRPKRISRKDKSVYHEIEFDVEWDPLGFHREQAYEESPSKALEGAITITGSGNNVQALTCLQYMTQTWPTSGPQLLRLLQDMVCNPGHPQTTLLSDKSTATALYSSADCKVRVAVSGSASTIAEVGEQLAWLGSAIRSSPVAERIVCCRPEIHQVWLDHSTSMPSRATGEFLLKFHFSEHEDSGPAPASANCWKSLFRNPVVVLGYPILRRPQANTGLEIPLAMMARLVNTQTLVDFCGRTFLKGFSAMVAVTEISAQAVFWHLFHNEYGSRISYEDPRVPQISDQAMVVDITQLETGRHILGWCGDVENYAGAPDANYDVEWSRLSDPDQSCAFQNVSISGGKFINAGFNLAIGIKDKPAHISFAPDDYIGTLIALEKRHFVFCDVEAKRSWLINGTNALLHLLRAALKDYENNRHLQRLNLLLLDRSKLHESEETHTSDAAFEFLANEHNLSLPLYKKSTETWTEKTTKLAPNDGSEAEQVLKQKSTVFRLKDRIDQIIRFLEQVIAHQDNVRTQNGMGFRLKHTPRRQLEGFDFMDLATKLDTIWPKVATLSKSGRGWVDFTRAIHAVTLFGTGFGELLRPKGPASGCHSCQWSISLPEGEDHLAVCVTDLRSIIRTNGSMRRRPWRLVNNIHWHVPDKAFEPCNCSISPKSGKCDRVQVLLPQSCRTLWTQVRSPEKLPDGDRGAVVFGHSWKFPLRWKSDGEPEEGQPAYDDDEEEGDSAFHDSGLGTSNEESSSGRSKPWSWSLPGRSPRTPTESSSGLYMQRNGPIVPSLCNDMKRGANDSEEGGTLDNGWPGPADGNEPKRGRWF